MNEGRSRLTQIARMHVCTLASGAVLGGIGCVKHEAIYMNDVAERGSERRTLGKAPMPSTMS